MVNDLALVSCEALLASYKAKKSSPVEALAAVLGRIERQNGSLNAFAHLDIEHAQTLARESERRWACGSPMGLLDGLPVTVKDLGLTRGMPTLRGSLSIDRRTPWLDDAPSVARVREQGAVLLGKTAVPEFGCKGTTDSRLNGITRNPWNIAMTPGGSSGGAVAAVASGMSFADIASDAAGSIRNPCALTGIVGLKPTFGRVPDYPPSPLGSMAVIGPISRTVRDAALLMNVLAAPDFRDPTSKPLDGEDFLDGIEDGVRDMRVAVSSTLGYARVDAEVLTAFESTVSDLKGQTREHGRVEEVFPDPGAVASIFLSVGLARLYGTLGPAKVADDMMDPAFIDAVRRGQRVTVPEYLEAVAARKNLIVTVARFFQRYDLLITPTVSVPAFPVGTDDPPVERFTGGNQWKPFSAWVNLTKLPAISVPCGATRQGLPVSLQVVGPRFEEARVLRMARAIEKAIGFRLPDLEERILLTATL